MSVRRLPASLQRFAAFVAVGAGSAVGHYGLLVTLVRGFGVDAVAASAAGALLGALINYALNYRFTFRSRKRHAESLPKFAAVAAAGLLWNTLLMALFVRRLGMNYLAAQALTTLLVLAWGFGAHSLWTFHTGRQRH